ncbi:MAG: tyrosine--tRNA ligase, partial [Bryobacteraceae bacterium]
DFDREVRQGEQPEDIETMTTPAEIGTNIAKILVAVGLADSRTDAERKIKAGAVESDGEKHTTVNVEWRSGDEHVLRVGRKWKRVLVP